jgi:MFS family permease
MPMPANSDPAAAPAKSPARPIDWPTTVGAFFAGSVLLWADRSNFSVAAAAWAKELNWTPSTIGLMLSAFSLGYLIVQPIGGWIADQVGPRRTLAGSMAGWSIWVLLTPLAPTVLWLTAAFRVLLGAFEAPYIPASVAAVARAIPSAARRGRFAAFMQSGAQLGPAAGVFFAGLILQATGSPTYIFVVFGVVGLIGAAAWWLYAKNFADPRPQGAQAETSEAKERAAQAPVPPRLLISSPALWPFYIGYFALPYCQYIFLTWLPQYLTHYRNIPLVTASALSALPFLVSFIGANFAGWAMDWLAERGFSQGGFHRSDLCGDDADCRNNVVDRGRGDHDHHRQCRFGVLCRAVLDDLHRCGAEPDRHVGGNHEFLRRYRRDSFALSQRRHRAGNRRVRRAALARSRNHARGGHNHDPGVPHQAADKPFGRDSRSGQIRGLT